MKTIYFFLAIFLFGCQSIESIEDLAPTEDKILTNGADLQQELHKSYATWWQSVHGVYPNLSLLVAADAFGLSRGDFGTIELGMEPRIAFPNQVGNAIAETPWYGCLSAVSSVNDVLLAMERGVSIDKGETQDQSVRAAAHLLRGLSWGYLALIFDQGILVRETTDLEKELPFVPYQEMLLAAIEELQIAIQLVEVSESDLSHNYFNGVLLSKAQFIQLAHAYIARFLAQTARTPLEYELTNWEAVFFHAERGIDFDFAPLADNDKWQSYQAYTFAETGKGPFWARLDQRLVAALDPTQPTQYPKVQTGEDQPLTNPKAQSDDARLANDFVYESRINFDATSGEWHFSHYKHHRNISQNNFAGDGWRTGSIPAFLVADNELLKAEAALNLGASEEAANIINNGTRTQRGSLSPVSANVETLKTAIAYERSIELLNAAPLGLWLDRRRWAARESLAELTALGGLQLGTPAQLPVPAKELRSRDLPIYTFGGENDPQGVEAVYR